MHTKRWDTILALLLSLAMSVFQIMPVSAADNNEQPAEMQEETAGENPEPMQSAPDGMEETDNDETPVSETENAPVLFSKSLDGLAVEIKADPNALPEGSAFVLEELDASNPALQDLQKTDGFAAAGFEMHFADAKGTIIQPETPVDVHFSMDANRFGQTIDADGLKLFHIKQPENSTSNAGRTDASAGEKTEASEEDEAEDADEDPATDSQQKADPSYEAEEIAAETLELKDGVITASFSADSFSPYIIQAKEAAETDQPAETPDSQSEPAEQPKDNAQADQQQDASEQPSTSNADGQPAADPADPSAPSKASNPYNQFFDMSRFPQYAKDSDVFYNLYCYTLIPGMTFNPEVTANAEWNGMGVGGVTGLPAPSYPINSSFNYLHEPGVKVYTPDAVGQNGYPDITATSSEDGATAVYKYAAPGSGNENTFGYYTIDWNAIVEASGANSGHNNFNPVVAAGIPVYHMNGVVYLNQKHLVTVSFYIKKPGQRGWTFLDATRVEKGSTGQVLEKDHLVPSLDPEKYPAYTFYNGTLYKLKYWSEEKDVADSFASKDLSAFTNPIDGNKAFYAGYEPIEAHNFTLTKMVNGKGAEPDRAFTFTLTMDAGRDFDNIPYELSQDYLNSASAYSMVRKGPGTYTFLLKNGQSLPKMPLVKGTNVTITEEDGASEGYSISWSVNDVDKRNSGPTLKQTIDEDTNVVCTDNKETWTVYFLFKNPGEGFSTMLKTEVPAVTSTYKTLLDIKQVSLAHKQKQIIQNGVIYTLKPWSKTEDFTQPVDFDSDTPVKNKETFYAGYEAAIEHNLTIDKTVEGEFAEKGMLFQSTLKLSYEGQPFSLSSKTARASGLQPDPDNSGEYTFDLSSGGKISVPICDGVTWQVTETDYSNNGYDCQYKINDQKDWQNGRSSEPQVMNGDASFHLLNTKKTITVTFMFRDAGASEFTKIGSQPIPDDTDSFYSMSQDGLIPSLANYPLKKEVTQDGKTVAYTLQGWNSDECLAKNTEINLGSKVPISENLTIYAGYTEVAAHSLCVTKKIDSYVVPVPDTFDFTLNLTWNNKPYTPGDTDLAKAGLKPTATKGTYTFSLKQNEQMVLDNVPDGTSYTVTEADYSKKGYTTFAGFTNKQASQTRSISNTLTETTQISFTNRKTDWTIKFVLLKAGQPNTGLDAFTLVDSEDVGAYTSTYQTLKSQNKIPSLEKYPETVIKDGTVYKLQKWFTDSKLTTKADFDLSTPLTQGETFFAAYIPVPDHTLTITKTVTGKGAEKDRTFDFELHLLYEGKSFNPSLEEQDDTLKAVKTGVYAFSLKAGGTLSLQLPEGVKYSVVEKDPSGYGYSTSWSQDGGAKQTGQQSDPATLTADSTVDFINHKDTWTINFEIAGPGSGDDGYQTIQSIQVPADTTTLQDLQNKIPTIDALEWPQSVAADGHVYTRSEWYTNSSRSIKADFSKTTNVFNGETFYAGYTETPDALLNVSKTVTGKGAQPDREFPFTLTLSFHGDPFALSENQMEGNGLSEIERGSYSFRLKAGESRQLDLPGGITAALSEDDMADEGYTTSYTLNDGSSQNGRTCTIETLKDEDTVAFANDKQQITVYFDWINPETRQSEQLASQLVPEDTTTQQMLKEKKLIPSQASLDQYMSSNGKAWTLDPTWYTDKSCTQQTNFENDDVLTSDETFYLHYVPAAKKTLTIQKTLTGQDGEVNRLFHFNLYLKWGGTSYNMSETQARAQGLVLNGNGWYSFSLQGGKSIQLSLPEGTIYRIDEQNLLDDGFRTTWNTSDDQDSRAQTLDSDRTAECTNDKESWTINFWLKSPGEADFNKFSSVQIPADTSTLQTLLAFGALPDLKDSRSPLVKDGIAYTLESWYYSKDLSEKVDFKDKTKLYNEEDFYAAYVPVATNTLTISKKVTGSGAEANRQFPFTLDLTYNGEKFALEPTKEQADTYSLKANKDGTWSFELQNGQSLTLTLPTGITWQVSEADMSNYGYTTQVNGQDGRASKKETLNDDASIEFENNKESWTVNFALINPATNEPQTVDSCQVAADTSTYNQLYVNKDIPNMDQYDKLQVCAGVLYELDPNWYHKDDFSNPIDFENSDDPLQNEETFYMHYIPAPVHSLTIKP